MAFLEYTPTQTLYQYCSIAGFRGIITSRTLWCTDLESANDPRELKLGFQHFMDALNCIRNEEYKGRAGIFLERLATEVRQSHERSQAFCACFSLARDALPMWAQYGDQSRGLAIGFRPSAITSMPGRIQMARYLNSDTAEDFRHLVRDIIAGFDPEHNPDDLIYWITAVTNARTAITALKHDSWEHEREIRFVFVQARADPEPSIPISQYPDETPVFWEAPQRRLRGTESVDYKIFPYGQWRQGTCNPARAIERVVIGSRSSLSIEEVAAELRENGFERFQVVRSECEIR
ncbi:MAG TPA: DUF2971 domain-containing protein [Gemmataceae bacterium]|nr:DUF2971 domain-containing protein [Gemmataceae bacterium]